MPVKIRKRRGKFRIVEAKSLCISKTKKGNAVDGGGHVSKTKAERHQRAINAAWARKKNRP